ncbi:MAG: oxygen-dependent coproporphyrinogen oxidase [Leadbetterella sp.]
MPKKNEIESYLKSLQDTICRGLEQADGKAKFHEDLWQHHTGGGGRSRIIQNGNIIEKGGVNFSAVSGPVSDSLKKQLQIQEDTDFFATGVSIVLHPHNPMVPIIHMNIRYFEMANGVYWFGGGIDLTPHYVVEEDARWFHTQLKNVCDSHHTDYYSQFKKWADAYFYIPHRSETRGVGGIFYDQLKENAEVSKEQIFDFMQSVGNSFLGIYTYFMRKNCHLPFTENHKKWQFLRRGRYVEFNLAWDRGTKFGLETGGRTESILMSLPPVANWEYDYKPISGSEEEKTLGFLKKGIDWVW